MPVDGWLLYGVAQTVINPVSCALVDDIAKISFSSSAFWLSENDGRK